VLRHVITLPGCGALKGLSASGWSGPGADFKISGLNGAAWKIVPGPTRGVDVATTWRHRRHVAPLQHVALLQHVASLQHVAVGLKCLRPSSGGARRTTCGRTGTRTGRACFRHLPGPPWALSEVR